MTLSQISFEFENGSQNKNENKKIMSVNGSTHKIKERQKKPERNGY